MSEMYGKIVIQTNATSENPVTITITNLETGTVVVDGESITTNVYSKVVPGLQAYDVAVDSEHKVVTVGFGDVSIPFSYSSSGLKPFLSWGDSAGSYSSIWGTSGVNTDGTFIQNVANCDFGSVSYSGSTITFAITKNGKYSWNGDAPVDKTVGSTFTAGYTSHHFVVVKTE